MEILDVAIVGAGWHGLAMAKTYLETCPNANLIVFDAAISVGGTWAKERLYSGLKTNNLVGSYEFSDFPMTVERFGVKLNEHIPGSVVHDYLSQFAEHFGLMSRMRLGCKVESARLLENGDWLLRVVSIEGEQLHAHDVEIVARKLVLATGLTSEPFMPRFVGQEDFHRDLFHAKELKHRAQTVEKAKEVVVLGGNKSAWDTCFLAAQSGAHVHMVMRPVGGGPSWVWPISLPFKLSVQRLASTRLFTWFDPCIWAKRTGPIGWLRYLLHRTFVGRNLVASFWHRIGAYAHTAHRYDEHPETLKLKPWVSPFWMGNSLSVHNYSSSWFDLVRQGRITVHIADIVKLSEGTVHLSNGTDLGVDAFVCCTGWKTTPPIRFIPEDLPTTLGINNGVDGESSLASKARLEIFANIPAVRQRPSRNLPPGVVESTGSPKHIEKSNSNRYQLYRFMVPPSEKFMGYRNIAFIGAHLALTATMVAQLQALWITAFFLDEIPTLKSTDIDHNKVQYETVLHNEYTKIRHPHEAGGSGERCPDLTFDCLPYMDLLADDLGLRKYRKAGIFAEVYDRYRPVDYQGIVQEWLEQRKMGRTRA